MDEQRNIKKVLRIIIPLFVVIIIGIYIIYAYRNGGPEISLNTSGTIEATEIDLSAEIAGKVAMIFADEGDSVKEGQVLIQLERDELLAQRDQIDAQLKARNFQLKQAKLKLENTKSNFKRISKLFNDQAASQQALDDVKTQLEIDEVQVSIAENNIEQTKAALRLIDAQLDNTILKTPITGMVLDRNVELGEIVLPGATLMSIADLDHLYLRIYVPESKLGRIQLGQDVNISNDSFSDKIYKGKIKEISQEAEFTPRNIQTKNERVRLMFAVKVGVDNMEHELKPGMPADAEIRLN